MKIIVQKNDRRCRYIHKYGLVDPASLAELRNFLSQFTSRNGFACRGDTVVIMSVDTAYMLAALAARQENLPRTGEERRAHKKHTTGGSHV